MDGRAVPWPLGNRNLKEDPIPSARLASKFAGKDQGHGEIP